MIYTITGQKHTEKEAIQYYWNTLEKSPWWWVLQQRAAVTNPGRNEMEAIAQLNVRAQYVTHT